MNENFKKIIEGVKEIKMTDQEKMSAHVRLTSFMESNPLPVKNIVPIKSPYFHPFNFMHFAKVAVMAVLVLAIGTGGLSYASAGALPGDLLYPIKINLNEGLRGSMISDARTKTVWQAKRLETRITEIKTLQASGKFTDGASEVATARFIEHASDLNASLAEASGKGDKETLSLVTERIKASFSENTKMAPSATETEDDEITSLFRAEESTIDDIAKIDSKENTSVTKPEDLPQKTKTDPIKIIPEEHNPTDPITPPKTDGKPSGDSSDTSTDR